jgi:hypothetical protein
LIPAYLIVEGSRTLSRAPEEGLWDNGQHPIF